MSKGRPGTLLTRAWWRALTFKRASRCKQEIAKLPYVIVSSA
jgi:hypothetical protein